MERSYRRDIRELCKQITSKDQSNYRDITEKITGNHGEKFAEKNHWEKLQKEVADKHRRRMNKRPTRTMKRTNNQGYLLSFHRSHSSRNEVGGGMKHGRPNILETDI